MALSASTSALSEHEAALRLTAKIQAEPAWFGRRLLGQEYWSKQVTIAESVRDNQRTTVRSCNGSGKTAAAGRLVIPWWLSAYPRSRVIFTGPTGRQLQNVWIEFTRAARSSRGLLAPSQPPKTSPHYEYRIGEDWFAQGFSTNEAERFAGHHEERILFIVDEASGVGEPIFEAIEGSLNTPGAHLLLIGNPTQIGGTFHRSCTTDRALYNVIHIGRDDLPWATGEAVSERLAANLSSKAWCDERAKAWGTQSPLYQVRVLGEFPSSADDSVISLGDLERAQGRDVVAGVPVEVGCDVARFGSDETVIATRHGWRCRIAEVYQGRDTMETAGRILRHADRIGASRVVVDDAGVGGGVTDRIRELRPRLRLEAFNASEKPKVDAGEYPNRRSEAWFALSDMIDEIDLDADEQLLADLAAPLYKLDSQSRRVVEPKADTKKRLGRSPDRADAVVMLFAPHPSGRMRVSRPRGRVDYRPSRTL